MKTQKFKQTEIGKIPEDWEVKELGSLLKNKGYIRGPFGSALRRPELKKYGIPVYEQEHAIYESRKFRYFIDNEKFKGLSRFAVEDNDLIISCSGTFGKVSIIKKEDPKGIISQALLILRPDVNKINPNYLRYFFTSKLGFNSIASRSLGSVQINIAKREVIEKIELAVPPLREQDEIVKILSELDAKIELNNKMNKTLEAIGQALFKKWFIDERKDEWKEGKLGDYADIIKGVSYRSGELKEYNKALVTLKSMNRGGGLNQNGFKEYIGEYKKEQEIIDGDIVVAYTDLTQKAEVIGRPAIVRKISKYEAIIASLDLAIIRPKDEKLNKAFLYYLLSSEDFQNHVQGFTNGTTVLHLSSKAVPNYVFSFPEDQLISNFGKIIQPLLDKRRDNEAETEVLIKIRDSLLPKLMSGEIRVK